jgi:uroporphyrin-III C-methyltransferase / precorrin-2 dehydrogenase / sirohydrochlorin ferrochelatase
VQYVTGHGAGGRLPEDIDWPSLADPGATTIVYMPARTLAAFAATAMARGLAAATPAVAVVNATCPDETVVAGSVADLPERLAAANHAGPVVVMIGRVFADVAAARPAGPVGASANPQKTEQPQQTRLKS